MTEKPARFTDELSGLAASLRTGVVNQSLRSIADRMDEAARMIERNCDAREVRRFSGRMTTKLARKSFDGLHGWRDVPVSHLWAMLRAHVEKGDPVDIANFAMMIAHNMETEADERPQT